MTLPGIAPLVLACLGLSACADFSSREALVAEREQTVSIESDPTPAQCTVLQGGRVVGSVTTPGPVTVTATGDDVYVICEKEGYEPAATWLRSDYDRTDPLLGTIAGWLIDPIVGSYYAYDDGVKIRLIENRDPNRIYKSSSLD
jgi:hypothetical protein